MIKEDLKKIKFLKISLEYSLNYELECLLCNNPNEIDMKLLLCNMLEH
jgi:hypothetical protein